MKTLARARGASAPTANANATHTTAIPFIHSSFTSRVDYDAWLKRREGTSSGTGTLVGATGRAALIEELP